MRRAVRRGASRRGAARHRHIKMTLHCARPRASESERHRMHGASHGMLSQDAATAATRAQLSSSSSLSSFHSRRQHAAAAADVAGLYFCPAQHARARFRDRHHTITWRPNATFSNGY